MIVFRPKAAANYSGLSKMDDASWQAGHVESAWRRNLIMFWLIGMFVLLPVEMVKLPLNMTLVDMWTVLVMPLVWLSIPRGRQLISLYYIVPMWLIFAGSFASIFVAPSARNGLVVLLKEIFAYIWFITVAAVLVRLKRSDYDRVVRVWSLAVLIHGLIIIAQFLSPELWQYMADHLGRGAGYEIYRPSGLFTNANGAAFFQLLGFVPLLLARPSKRIGAILGLVLLSTMLATGSMGAILSFAAGAVVALAILALKGRITVVAQIVVRFAVAALVLGAVFLVVISQNARYQTHLQKILIGRAERSSDSRFNLWERGLDVFVEEGVFLWGIGPENFRVVDGNDNQLHNDFMAFAVERGLVSTAGLGLFAMFAILRATSVFLLADGQGGPDSRLVVVVLLAAMIAAFAYSLTHQVFHNRQLWLILALQEAIYFILVKQDGRFEARGGMAQPATGGHQYTLGSEVGGT